MNSSDPDLTSFLTSYNFYNEGILEFSTTYSFNGNSYVKTDKNKRSGALTTDKGNCEVKSAKFSDKGTDFFYVKCNYSDGSGSFFMVYRNGMLIIPEKDKKYGVIREDQYGLNIKEFHVSMAPDYRQFELVSK